jgi:PAS domain S-box-containing protein
MHEGLLVIGRDFVIKDLNERFLKEYGGGREDIIGRTCHEITHNADEPCSGDDHLCPVKEVFSTGRPAHAEHFHVEGSGKEMVVRLYAFPLLGADGNVDHVVELSQNITERRRAEEEAKVLQAHLQRAEKMEAIGTLAGGVAHDLNNILSGLVGYPELLLVDLPEDSPLRAPILAMQNSGKKAAATVQDLLTLARRGVAVTEVANLNDVVSEYLRSPEHQKLKAFHPDAQIQTSYDTDLLNVLASPVHMSKSVMNLVSNAAEALSDGGVVTISTSNRYVDRPIRGYDEVKEGDYAVLTVVDNGIGISPDDLGKVFEPFYTKKVMGRSGTGLGMAVVWGTVKDHNGYIGVESTVGKGTTIELYFPVTRREAEKEKTAKSIEQYMGNGERILVVDDVKEQRDIASMLLAKLGYSVHAVSCGEEAVEYLKTNSADLLVLDMIMDPGMDGLDTYKRILQVNQGQKAIIASGFSETDRVKKAQKLGAGQYVRKPYTLETVGVAVRAELDADRLV